MAETADKLPPIDKNHPLTGKVARKSGKVDPDRDFGQPDKVEEEGR